MYVRINITATKGGVTLINWFSTCLKPYIVSDGGKDSCINRAPIIIVKKIIVILGKIINLYEKLLIIEKTKNKTPNEPIIVVICSIMIISFGKKYSGVRKMGITRMVQKMKNKDEKSN